MTQPVRMAITGAAGRISYSLLFRVAAGGLFGPDQPVELRLLDTPEEMPHLEATAMELHDCAFPSLKQTTVHDCATDAFENADWVVLLGSASYRPGMTRTDLLRANAPLFQAHGRAINEAAKTARVLTVANPCNVNCLIASSYARDIPAERWFAMMRLDQNRARGLLAEKAEVSIDRVSRVAVWGNHSPTVFPDFHNALIDGRPAPDVVTDREWVRQVFEPTVRGRGAELVRMRGASPAGSAAQAIIGSIRSLTTPTPLGQHFSAAVVSDGSYGVPRGLVFGFPLRAEDGKTWHIVQDHYLDEYAQDRIRENVAELEFETSSACEVLGDGFRGGAAARRG